MSRYVLAQPKEEAIKRAIKTLQNAGCPREIIDRLWDWQNEPVVTLYDLKRWIRSIKNVRRQ